MAQCPKCGTQSDGLFCPSCGARVTQPQAQQAAASMNPPPQPPQYQPPQSPQYQPPQPPQYQAPQPPQYQAPQPPQYQAPQPPQYQAPQPPAYGQAPQYPPQPPQYPGQPAPFPGQPGAYPGYQPPRKKGGVGKVILIIFGVIVALFAILIVIGAMLPDEGGTTDPVPANSSSATTGILDGPIITDRVNQETQQPLTASKAAIPTSTDLIYASVQVNLKQGQVVTAQWYYEGERQDHLDTDYEVPVDYDGWISFHIGNDGEPWPSGSVRVQILLDGVPEAEAVFNLK